MPTALEDIIKLKKEVSLLLLKHLAAPKDGRIREGESSPSAKERSDAESTGGNLGETGCLSDHVRINDQFPESS